MMLYSLTVAATLLATVGCCYAVLAMILVGRFARQRKPLRPAATPGVTILKPLHGDEPGLFNNLASFCNQNYRAILRITHTADDLKRLQRLYAARDLELVVDARSHGSNRKVSNLANMAEHIRHDVVVVSDSDMHVDPAYLSRVVAALETPGVSAVTCLYYGAPATGIWAQLSALAINAHFLPGVVVGLASGLARPCFGSTIALRRETLDEIGGFRAVADRLADDHAIGEALARRGRTIAIPPFAIAHRCTQMSARELWQHELRWARTIWSIDPIGYAGSMITYAFPWALIATLLAAASDLFAPALGITFAALACRMALLRAVEREYGLPPQDYWLVPVRDLLSFAVFVCSFLGREVSWKGHRYRLPSGRMASAGSPQP